MLYLISEKLYILMEIWLYSVMSLHLNHFKIVCHKATSQENVMGFQIQIWLPVMKQDISYMFNVEDTRTKSMCIMHLGDNNWIGKSIISVCLWNIIYYYEIWPCITPIMKIIFQHSVPTAAH